MRVRHEFCNLRIADLKSQEDGSMRALFIGQTYIDVTLLTDSIPTGDAKTVAQDYAVSFGGNAVTAAFA